MPGLAVGARRIDRGGGDVGAHHHAGAAAGRRVVDRAVLVGGEVADVDDARAAHLPSASALPARLKPSGPGNISGKMVSTVARQEEVMPRACTHALAGRSCLSSQVSSLADALHLDRPARLEHEALAKRLAHRAGHLNLAGKPVQFQPRGEIHRLAPHVVGEFVGADHPGHHRPVGDADPDLQIDAMRGGEPGHQIGQQQRHARQPRQMIGLRAG